jgi:mannonate dehydratase
MNRRYFLGMAASSGLLATGCDLSLQHGVFNACAAEAPANPESNPLIAAAWRGLDPAKVLDSHCHVFGDGDSGSGLWFNPMMEQIWRPYLYMQRKFYMNASCVDDTPGRLDVSFVERLLAQCDAMPAGFRALLFAFDWAHDDAGVPDRIRSTFHVPDAYVAGLAARHPARFRWAASIHPYDPRAVDRLDAAAAGGALAVKWLPSAQGIDPADARCDRFYARLAATRIPLVSHAGDERAVVGFGEHLGNPLRLRRPLDAGVRVVVAHCASLGMGKDTDRGGETLVPNFELFARLMDTTQYRANLVGEISAITQANRMHVIPALLARPDWLDRLVNGSDYPLPGVVPLIALQALVEANMLDPRAVEPLRRIRDYNAILFDLALKRSLAVGGVRFPVRVFESRAFFEAIA